MAAVNIGRTIDVYAGALADRPGAGEVKNGSRYFATDEGVWYLTVDGGTTWVNFTEPGQPIHTVALADESSIDFPDATSGFCVAVVSGTVNYRVIFDWLDDGSTGDIASDWDKVKYTDTDGYLCIITTGTQVSIKNRTGGAITLGMLRMVV